jgi:rod shape determining protein RodA
LIFTSYQVNLRKNFASFFMSLSQKIEQLNWLLISLITVLAFVGFIMLYSAGGGSFKPWLIRQLFFFILFFPLMIAIAVIDISLWFRFAYIAYAVGLVLVIIVDIMGHSAMGATRWFRLGSLTIQPSEIMKVCTVFALARYFYNVEAENIVKVRYAVIPVLLIIVPAVFIFHQPDLGTASILVMAGVTVLFVAGIRMHYFIAAGTAILVAIPFAWHFLLYGYQKDRVLTFMNPGNDPLGSGYNIIQSKIAIGSGGFIGKGYLNGTQGQLNFLPEKQTDFIFTMLSEELGFIGSIFTIGVYCAIIAICVQIAMNIKHQYGRLLTMGVASIFFIHMFINMGMGMGLLPVVGAPLPFVSYGGTIMATMMIGFGLILNADLYKNSDPKLR